VAQQSQMAKACDFLLRESGNKVTKDDAKLAHQATIRELVVFAMAGIELTVGVTFKERQARIECEKHGVCRCKDTIKKKL